MYARRTGASSITTTTKMSLSMDWTHDFCLACDRQTDGSAYCSEGCRLAEYESSPSRSGSEATSPSSPSGSIAWGSSSKSNNGFYLPPAYNFKAHKSQPSQSSYTTTSPQSSHFSMQRPLASPTGYSQRTLTPSSSQSSLISMQSAMSTTSTGEPQQLSDNARKALRAYASSFDQSRYSRRPSS